MNFEEVFSYEHLLTSAKLCCNGTRWKSSTQMFELNKARWVSNLHNDLHSENYTQKELKNFTINERGKSRNISALHISDRCVQKCLCKYYLKPLITPKLIYDNSANVEGKGTEFAIKRLKQHLAYHYKKHNNSGGILLVDYHKYFQSIDHAKLLSMLRNDIEDDKIFRLISKIVNSFPGNTGLGLGSEISQILAVYYPNKIDHFVKEKLHIKGYGRYMDDSYLIHGDISYLKRCNEKIVELSNDLGLNINNNKTKIIPLKNSFMYLNKRFMITDTGKIVVRLSRDNIRRRRNTVKKQAKKGVDFDSSYNSWRGYAKHYNSHNTIQNMDKLVFDLKSGGTNRHDK